MLGEMAWRRCVDFPFSVFYFAMKCDKINKYLCAEPERLPMEMYGTEVLREGESHG